MRFTKIDEINFIIINYVAQLNYNDVINEYNNEIKIINRTNKKRKTMNNLNYFEIKSHQFSRKYIKTMNIIFLKKTFLSYDCFVCKSSIYKNNSIINQKLKNILNGMCDKCKINRLDYIGNYNLSEFYL